MSIAIASTSSADNARWQSFYSNAITRQIDHLISLIEKKKKTPDALFRHFDSMLAVFKQGVSHPDPATRLKLIDFVRTLHPLPLWWGKWSEWMHVLEQTTYITQEENKVESQIWLSLVQAEMLLSTGRGKNSQILSKKALKIAQENQNAEMILRAKLSLFEANKYLGIIDNILNSIIFLESLLKEKKELLSSEVFQELEFEILLKKTDILRRQGHNNKAAQNIQLAYSIAKELFDKNDLFIAKLYNQRSTVYEAKREFDLAIRDREKSLEIFTFWGDDISQIECEGDIGLIHWSAGNYKRAEEVLLSSVKKAEKQKLLRWQAIQVGNLALPHLSCGRLEQTVTLLERHRDLSKLTNNYAEEKRALGNLGTVQVHLGQFKEALENMQKDHQHVQKLQLNVATARLYAKMSWALDGLGKKADAIDYAQKSLKYSIEMNEPLSKVMALRCLSDLDIPTEDKIRYAEEARDLAKKYNRKLNEAGALFTLADAYKDQSYYDEAVKILKEIGAEEWLKVPLVFKTLRLPLLL